MPLYPDAHSLQFEELVATARLDGVVNPKGQSLQNPFPEADLYFPLIQSEHVAPVPLYPGAH